MHSFQRAKIVATVGPVSASKDMLRAMVLAGVDTFRLNFSHGSHADHARSYAAIRSLETELCRPIGVLQDLQGPKIRVGAIPGGRRHLSVGEIVRFVPPGSEREPDDIPLPHPEIFAAVAPRHKLLIDDGRVGLRVREVDRDFISAVVEVPGAISDRKGVSLPDTLLDLCPLTEKDRVDLAFGLDLGVDWVALSFVQKASDVLDAQQLIQGRAGLIAKIEKPSALQHLDDIIRLADGIMVARGDLGVEIPPEEVPGRQKEIVRACRLAVKPVIVATQMLDSMTVAPTPTRAEASDVATAIYDGADAVMLSAESASGAHPLEAVQMMARIIRSTEAHGFYASLIQATKPEVENTPAHAVASAAADVASAIGAPVIVAFTSSGTTAARIARKRPALPILAITPDAGVNRRLTLLWGVRSVQSEHVEIYDRMIDLATDMAVRQGFISIGEVLVVVSGFPFNQAGTTNNIRVVQA